MQSFNLKAFLVALLTATCRLHLSTASTPNLRSSRRELGSSLIVCDGLLIEENYGDGITKERLACELDHKRYIVEVDEEWFKTVIRNSEFVSGETSVSLTDYEIVDDTFIIRSTIEGSNPPSLTRMFPEKDTARRLAITTGTRTILAVNIIHNDIHGNTNVNPYTNSELSDDLFNYAAPGSDYWENTLYSQTLHCSNGKLTFQPTADRVSMDPAKAGHIVNGVATVSVNTDCTNYAAAELCYEPMEVEVSTALAQAFNVADVRELADHMVYCMPLGKTITASGKNEMPMAIAFVNDDISMYRDKQCLALKVLMHEIGHNLYLPHSGENETLANGPLNMNVYGDKSGVMGSANGDASGNRVCYNGAKNWKLGWYAEYNHEFQLTDGLWQGNMIGIAEIAETDPLQYTAIVKINHYNSTKEDYFVSFNRMTSFNADVAEGGDQVLVHQRKGEIHDYTESWRVAELNQGQSFTTSSGVTVTVESIDLASTPAVAVVTCSYPVPTDSPSGAPSSPPTLGPTPIPTPQPSPGPTPAPVDPMKILAIEDFESGEWNTTIFKPGKKNARITSLPVHTRSGSHSLLIRGSSPSSYARTKFIRFHGTDYSTVKLSFWFRTKSVTEGEEFVVRYKTVLSDEGVELHRFKLGDASVPINTNGDTFMMDRKWYQAELFVNTSGMPRIIFEFQTLFTSIMYFVGIDDIEIIGYTLPPP